MTQTHPDWFTLIEHWVTRGGTGYTLPFLVGARAIHQGRTTATKDDARILVDEMFNHPVEGHMLELTWCGNLDAPVFGLKSQMYVGKAFNSAITNTPSIFVRDDIVQKWGASADELIRNILTSVEVPIAEGKFSRSYHHEWQSFDSSERFRIENLLGEAK